MESVKLFSGSKRCRIQIVFLCEMRVNQSLGWNAPGLETVAPVDRSGNILKLLNAESWWMIFVLAPSSWLKAQPPTEIRQAEPDCPQRVKKNIEHECIVESVKYSEVRWNRHVKKRAAIVHSFFFFLFCDGKRSGVFLSGCYLKADKLVKPEID